MHTIHLDGRAWRTEADVYRAVLAALGAPAWHGHNLDALADSLGGGDLNAVNPPVRLAVGGAPPAGSPAAALLERLAVLVADLRAGGTPVDLLTDAGGQAAHPSVT